MPTTPPTAPAPVAFGEALWTADGWSPGPFAIESRTLEIPLRAQDDEDDELLVEDPQTGVKARVGVLRIEGLLQRRPSFWARLWDSEALGPYEKITAEVNRMREEGYAGLVLLVDSGGGMVHGLADPVRAIIRARQDMPVWSLCLGMGASAAYPLLAAAGRDRTFATGGASIGSLAARLVLEDSSEMAKELGIRVLPLTGGSEDKATGVFGAPISEEQAARVDEQIRLAREEFFFPLIADALGTDIPDVRRMAAGGLTYTATEAFRLGLIAGITTEDEFFERVTGSITRETAMPNPRAPAAPQPAPVDPDASATPAEVTATTPTPEPAAAAQPEPAADQAPAWFTAYRAEQAEARKADRAEIARLTQQLEAQATDRQAQQLAGYRERLEAVQAGDMLATVEAMITAGVDPEPVIAQAENRGDPVASLRQPVVIEVGEGGAARTVDLTYAAQPMGDGSYQVLPESRARALDVEDRLAPAAGDPEREWQLLCAGGPLQ